MKAEEINHAIFPIANEGKIIVADRYYPLNGYYQNLLFAYSTLDGTYILVDIIFN